MNKMKLAKTNTIYYRFLKLLAAALVAALLFFLLLNWGGSIMLRSYFEKTNYMERENQRRVDDFRNYVEKNKLTSMDSERLS